MWHHGFFPIVPIVFFVLMVALIVSRIIAFRRCGWRDGGRRFGRFEAEAILQKRLASGEIGEEEYTRLLEILAK